MVKRYIIIHCSATKPSQNIDIDTIAEWHLARGILGVGNSKVITRSGEIQDGRSIHDVQAANKGFNSISVAICLIGGVSQKNVKVPENNLHQINIEGLLTIPLSFIKNLYFYPSLRYELIKSKTYDLFSKWKGRAFISLSF